jgi:hypothetical protein
MLPSTCSPLHPAYNEVWWITRVGPLPWTIPLLRDLLICTLRDEAIFLSPWYPAPPRWYPPESSAQETDACIWAGPPKSGVVFSPSHYNFTIISSPSPHLLFSYIYQADESLYDESIPHPPKEQQRINKQPCRHESLSMHAFASSAHITESSWIFGLYRSTLLQSQMQVLRIATAIGKQSSEASSYVLRSVVLDNWWRFHLLQYILLISYWKSSHPFFLPGV